MVAEPAALLRTSQRHSRSRTPRGKRGHRRGEQEAEGECSDAGSSSGELSPLHGVTLGKSAALPWRPLPPPPAPSGRERQSKCSDVDLQATRQPLQGASREWSANWCRSQADQSAEEMATDSIDPQDAVGLLAPTVQHAADADVSRSGILSKARPLPPPLPAIAPIWLLPPPPKPVCMAFLVGSCPLAAACIGQHLEGEDAEMFRERCRRLPCYFGSACVREPCLFSHEAAAENGDSKCCDEPQTGEQAEPDEDSEHYRADAQSQAAQEEIDDPAISHFLANDIEEALLQRAWLQAGSSSAFESDTSDGEFECKCELPTPRRQSSCSAPAVFRPKKEEPRMLLYGPDMCVVMKPAGWYAAERSQDITSSVSIDEAAMLQLCSSGLVEPLESALRPYSIGQPFLPAQPVASGCTILVETADAERWLTSCRRGGRLTFYSLALVRGTLDPARLATCAWRTDGALEVSAIAGYSTPAGGSYLLLLLRSMGSACGCEQALLQTTWGESPVGDEMTGETKVEQDDLPALVERPFFHVYGVGLGPGGDGDPGFSVVGPLTMDLRAFLAALRTDAKEIHNALVSSGRLPGDAGRYVGSSVPNMGCQAIAAPIAPKTDTVADPCPFGIDVWQDSAANFIGNGFENDNDDRPGGIRPWLRVTRLMWALAFTDTAMQNADEYGLRPNQAGEVRVGQLFRRFPALADACWRDPFMLLRWIDKDTSKKLAVVLERRSIRRRPPLERLQTFVEAYAMRMAPGETLTAAELRLNAHIQELLAEAELPDKPLIECLNTCPYFDVDRAADALRLHSLEKRVLLVAEALLLKPDGLILTKMSEFRSRGVPLAWLLHRYSLRLGGPEPLAFEVAAEALRASTQLCFEDDTCFVSRRTISMQGSEHTRPPPPPPPVLLWKLKGRGRNWLAQAKLLRELLDFYFEPFSLQHCRLILFSAEEERSSNVWRWRFSRLAQKLARIGRLVAWGRRTSALLAEVCDQTTAGKLQNVSIVQRPIGNEIYVELTYPANFRMPVIVPEAPSWVSRHFTRPREELPVESGLLGGIVVLSLALASPMEFQLDAPAMQRQRWHRRVIRQVLAYDADIICLQQCQAHLASPCRPGHGNLPQHGGHCDLLQAVIARLEGEDYDWCAAPSRPPAAIENHNDAAVQAFRANIVMWRRRFWRFRDWRSTESGALQVDLQRHWAPHKALSVTCLEAWGVANLSTQLLELSGHEHWRQSSLLCGTFAAEPQDVAACLHCHEDFRGFRSAHKEVLGSELPWTRVEKDADGASSGPSGKRPALPKSPDGIWIAESSLTVVASLGKGPGPPDRETLAVDHMPLIVAMEHQAPGGVDAKGFQPDPLVHQMLSQGGA